MSSLNQVSSGTFGSAIHGMENTGERRSLGDKISSLLDVLSLHRYLGRAVPEAFGSVVWSSGERPRLETAIFRSPGCG